MDFGDLQWILGFWRPQNLWSLISRSPPVRKTKLVKNRHVDKSQQETPTLRELFGCVDPPSPKAKTTKKNNLPNWLQGKQPEPPPFLGGPTEYTSNGFAWRCSISGRVHVWRNTPINGTGVLIQVHIQIETHSQCESFGLPLEFSGGPRGQVGDGVGLAAASGAVRQDAHSLHRAPCVCVCVWRTPFWWVFKGTDKGNRCQILVTGLIP